MINDSLNDILTQMGNNPLVTDISMITREGIHSVLFSDFERSIGFEIDESIKLFYKEFNGLKLHIEYDQQYYNDHKNSIAKNVTDPLFYLPEDEENQYLGLNILPFEEVFTKCYFNFSSEIVKDFNNKKYTVSSLANWIRPFDLFSGFTCAAFFIDIIDKKIKVLLLDDHYDNWFDSYLIDFKMYWEIVLKGYFSTQARKNILIKSDDSKHNDYLIKNKINGLKKPLLFSIKL